MNAALLVIDVQKAFFDHPVSIKSLNDAIETINEAICIFREKHLPVISIQHMNPGEDLVPGREGFDLPGSLKILPEDRHFHKTYGNSFNQTGLKEYLQSLAVDTVILTGYCAEFCVLATSIGAEDQDLMPIVLKGSLASSTPERIRFVEEINEVISLGALEKFL